MGRRSHGRASDLSGRLRKALHAVRHLSAGQKRQTAAMLTHRLRRALLPAFLAVGLAGAPGLGAPSAEPVAVPTFHSIGLRWRPPTPSSSDTVAVHFRVRGAADWRPALPLWFDPQSHASAPEHSGEHRGSILNLLPGTEYEIRLRQGAAGEERTLVCRTWDESFRIAERRPLPPGTVNGPLHIVEGGDSVRGYVLYESASSNPTLIDVGPSHEHGLRIDASHVIVRGVTVRGGSAHGIVLGDVTDVVLDRCDVSGWGSNKPGLAWGRNLDSAIFSSSRVLERIVVQRCRLHHPRSDANSWGENGHPEGPQGITFRGGRGRYVIRYNEITSDEEHCFNDGMGEVDNFGHGGFPNRDSDIYGNLVSHCWDDAIEAEGANLNVRIWGNHLAVTFNALGLATTSLGPQYVFRNTSGFSRYNPPGFGRLPYPAGGFLFKLGTRRPRADTAARGAVYLLHNAQLQPLHQGAPAGMRRGAHVTDPAYAVWNVTSRNNILHTRTADDEAVNEPTRDPSNSFDHDLYTGAIIAAPGAQAAGIRAAPRYQGDPGSPAATLVPGSPGVDAAVPLPTVNDAFAGAGPDIGANESGMPVFVPGIEADWTRHLLALAERQAPRRP